MRHRATRGFILIIVVALLGVLAYLSLSLAQQSVTARSLSRNHSQVTRARLLARSGFEAAQARLLAWADAGRIHDPQWLASSAWSGQLPLAHSPGGSAVYNASVQDLASCLNVNDGILAGTLESQVEPVPGVAGLHPPGYRANAVDPWPEVNGAATQDTSAFINLRIRSLLNAYGDVLMFIGTLGWPQHVGDDFDNGDIGNFGQSFNRFTSTDAGPKYRPLPGRDSNGQPLHLPADIAAHSTGLGDRLVASRPQAGYRTMEQVRGILESWALDVNLPMSGYPQGVWQAVSHDFCLNSFEDAKQLRLRREFGPDLNGDGLPEFEPDVTVSRVKMAFMDTDPPNLHDLWRPHAAALVNLNTASNRVRASLFYAPVNVSYSCEGMGVDHFHWNASSTSYPYADDYGAQCATRPSLGVSGPVFQGALLKENGVAGSEAAGTIQPRRLMSLRDACVLSRAWVPFSQGQGRYPVDFDEFERHLRNIRKSSLAFAIPLHEKVPVTNRTLHKMTDIFVGGGALFSENWLQATLPRIFSGNRRLPGWMGAPEALLSPYVQEGGLVYQTLPANVNLAPQPDMALRSIEDFVHRCPHPKVSFLPTGRFRIRSLGRITEGATSTVRRLEAGVEAFRFTQLASQGDFLAHSDLADTSPEIRFGPEPTARGSNPLLPPHSYLGCVGLRDRHDAVLPATAPIKTALWFDETLDPDPQTTFFPTDADTDPIIDDPNDPNDQFDVEEDPPMPYPKFVQGPWNEALYQALNNTPRPPGKTWKVLPSKTTPYLFTIYGPNYPDPEPGQWFTPNSSSQAHDKLQEWYPGIYPYPPTPIPSMIEMHWWMLAHRLNGTFPLSLLLTGWKDGVLPHQTRARLMDSKLEGSEVSLFRPGSSGSDLSPFNGVMLSPRGHGSRAKGGFNDSLYFRPTDIIPSGSHAGSTFGKFTLSMWYRLPSGYFWVGAKQQLMHMNLWERVFMCPNDVVAYPQPWQVVGTFDRPFQVSAYLIWNDNAPNPLLPYNPAPQYGLRGERHRNSAIGVQPDIDWLGEALHPLPSFPFPPIPGPRAGDGTLGVYEQMLSYHRNIPMHHIDSDWLERFKPGLAESPEHTVRLVQQANPYLARPGLWKRLVLTFNNSRRSDNSLVNLDEMFHGYFGSPISAAEPPSPFATEYTPDSLDTHMMLSFGEIPTRWWSHYDFTTNQGPQYTTSRDEQDDLDFITKHTYFPARPLHSAIDNIVMTLGEPLDVISDHESAADDIETHPEFFSLRYDIRSDNEPAWVLNPALPPGSRLLALTARIEDPPTIEQTTPQGPHHGFPRVDCEAVLAGTPLSNLHRSAAIMRIRPYNHAAASNLALGNYQVHSSEVRTYAWALIHDPSLLRIRLKWKSQTPHSTTIEPKVTSIPWVQEVGWIWRRGTPQILSWSED